MKLFSIEELATLTAQGNTDCVSIYMPTFKMSTETLQNPIRFKNLMREAVFNEPVETLAQQWAQELNQAFEQPPLAIDVGQRLYSTVRQFQRDTIDNLPSFLGATLALGATWILAASVRRLTLFGSRQWEVDRNSKILVSRLMYGSVWVIGSIVALGVLGLDFATLVGTLGLTSVAIGFSLRSGIE